MKTSVRIFILFLSVILLLCGCGKDKQVEETYPVKDVSDVFAGVDIAYSPILESYSSLGYAQLDLDGNGRDELLITDGTNIYEMYAVCEDGKTYRKLEMAGDIREIFLCTDNRIYVHQSDGDDACHYYHVYGVTDAVGNLPMELCVLNLDGNWYAGTNQKDEEPVTETEARALLDELKFTSIDYVPFFG